MLKAFFYMINFLLYSCRLISGLAVDSLIIMFHYSGAKMFPTPKQFLFPILINFSMVPHLSWANNFAVELFNLSIFPLCH